MNAPPPPIPFKLNLKPGEILTRVPPPSRSQTTPPERNQPPGLRTISPGAAEQPTSERYRPGPPGQIDPRHAYRSNGRHEWSPERLYEDYAGSTPVVPKDGSQHCYAGAMASSAAAPPAAMPRTDARPIMRPSPDTRQREERLAAQNHVTFQQQPQQPRQVQQVQPPLLSRSISQPVQPSSASAYSTSSASISRAPPSALDRFRPKQIVLPAPLQAQSQNQNGTSYTLPSELNGVRME